MRQMVAEDLGMLTCSCCGGWGHMRPYSPWHHTPICKPCFMIWYDSGLTDPKEIGELSMLLKRQGLYPWGKHLNLQASSSST